MPVFTPRPTIRAIPIDDSHECLVVDDVLEEPERWVRHAAERRDAFSPAGKAYPGTGLELPLELVHALDDFFRVHVRSRLGGRRTLGINARMALVTRRAHELEPRQWLCHRDNQAVGPDQLFGASVLYLFHDEALGGTSFYRPRQSADITARLLHDSSTMDAAGFSARHGLSPGYLLDTNAWFERLLTVPPRFNRMVFYDGGLFHSAHIAHPERLTDDPATGRLTINGFFTCTTRAR